MLNYKIVNTEVGWVEVEYTSPQHPEWKTAIRHPVPIDQNGASTDEEILQSVRLGAIAANNDLGRFVAASNGVEKPSVAGLPLEGTVDPAPAIDTSKPGPQPAYPVAPVAESFFVADSLELAKRKKLADLAARRYEIETAGIWVNGARLSTDRSSVAALSSAHVALSSGVVSTVPWKAGDGSWFDMDVQTATTYLTAVRSHVDAAFAAERELGSRVVDALTVEEVERVQL